MTSIYIATHQADALGRLLDQYRSKPLLASVLNAFTFEIQALEDVFQQILATRSILTSAGAQLDALGQVVGLPRILGLNDVSYQSLLLAEVGLNTSQGSPESVISAFRLISGSTVVNLYEVYPANVALMGNAQIINQTIIDSLQVFCQAILSAGVSVDYFGYFDPVVPFAFAGGPSTDGGFGDANDPTVGGRFAALYTPNVIFFGFDGEGEVDIAGFSDVNAPSTGGQFASTF